MIDFRAILKSKVPTLANLDQPSFENIYQNFTQSVAQHGLGNVDTLYNTARISGDQVLQAVRERVAQQAAVVQPDQSPANVSTAAPTVTALLLRPLSSCRCS